MGSALRLITSATIVAVVASAGSVSAQTGAAGGLSSPTGEPAPVEETVPAPVEGTVPAPPGSAAPVAPNGPTYAPPQPGYGDPRYAATAIAPTRPRSTVDRTQKHVGVALSVAGAAVFANMYLTVALVGALGGSDWLVAPVIGPFGAIAEDSWSYDNPVYWVDGFGQIIGFAALAVGLGLRFSFQEDPALEGDALVTPWLGPGGGGLGLTGTF